MQEINELILGQPYFATLHVAQVALDRHQTKGGEYCDAGRRMKIRGALVTMFVEGAALKANMIFRHSFDQGRFPDFRARALACIYLGLG